MGFMNDKLHTRHQANLDRVRNYDLIECHKVSEKAKKYMAYKPYSRKEDEHGLSESRKDV